MYENNNPSTHNFFYSQSNHFKYFMLYLYLSLYGYTETNGIYYSIGQGYI